MKAAQHEIALQPLDPVSAVGRFVSGFTHRLQSPLTGVKGYSTLLGREEDCERRLYWEQRLHGGLAALDRMIEGFRRYQLPEHLAIQCVPAAAMADEAWSLAVDVTPGAAAKEAALANDLPPAAVWRVDPFFFRNLLVNLFQNALDASPPRGRVRVACAPGELLRVEDAGPGLGGLTPAEIQQPFFTTRADRAGLGLAVASAIAAAHGYGLAWRELTPTGLCARVVAARGAAARSES